MSLGGVAPGPGAGLPAQACEPSGRFVFVSYARADEAVVHAELARIRSLGVRVWFDEGIDPGTDWPEFIAQALDRAAAFVVMITPRSVLSAHVRNEVNAAVRWRKPMLAVHLEQTVLPKGLELQLGSTQAIMRWQLDEDSYARKLIKALAPYGDEPTEPEPGHPDMVGDPDVAWGVLAGRRPVSLPPRLTLLAGRQELLREVEHRLCAPDRPWPRVVALHGLGGTGKTSVAVEHAHRHQEGMGLAWLLPAQDVTVLEAEFGALAAMLGAGSPEQGRDPVAAVHAVLAATSAPWLLVFDNAPDAAAVRRFLPPAGRGQVLVTSQSATWPAGQGVPVPVLDAATAARFLVSRTGDSDDAAAAKLADELGGLPLALEQAAAYALASGTMLSGYLAMFRQRRADLLARGEALGHPATVAATLGLALSRLDRDAPPATALLRLLAALAPEPVPLGLLFSHTRDDALADCDGEAAAVLRDLLADQVSAADAVAALQRYSLVSLTGRQTVSVHRLVRAVVRDQVAGQAASWHQAAASLTESAIPASPEQPATWPSFAALLPHALAVLEQQSQGLARIATYLGDSGNYPGARDLFQAIVSARETSLGRDHPDTIDPRDELAYWTGMAGDPAAARDMYAGLVATCERSLGPGHTATLYARHNLANWTGETGDAARARDLYAELLPVRERVNGADNAAALMTRQQLASWTGQAGDAARARDLHAELLPDMERVLGPEHLDTLAVRNNVARWTGGAGDPASARDMYAELLPVIEQVLGAEHPRTLMTRASLARWTEESGEQFG